MTIEEAKAIFINRGFVEADGGLIYDPDKWRESVKVISDWLEQEPCEDCVNRRELNNKIEMLDRRYGSDFYWEVKGMIDKLPSVYPKQRKTSWVRGKNDSTLFFCRRCGKGVNPYWKYCPHCGAKMFEPMESEDKE